MTWEYEHFDAGGSLYSGASFSYPLQTHGVFATEPRVGPGEMVRDPLIAADGKVFFGVGNKVYALDINGQRVGASYEDTAIEWSYTYTPGWDISHLTYIPSSGNIDENRLYVTAQDAVIVLNADNGTELWTYALGGDAVIQSQVFVNSFREIHFPVKWATVNGSLVGYWKWCFLPMLSDGDFDVDDGLQSSANLSTFNLDMVDPRDIFLNTGMPSSNENGTAFYLTTGQGYIEDTGERTGTSNFYIVTRALGITTIALKDEDENDLACECRGTALGSSGTAYMTSQYGLFQMDISTYYNIAARHNNSSEKLASAPALIPPYDSNQTIYYRSDNTIYALESTELGELDLKWSSSIILPDSKTISGMPLSLEPVIIGTVTGEGGGTLFIPSANDDSTNNVHIIKDMETYPELLYSAGAGDGTYYIKGISIIGPPATYDNSFVINLLPNSGTNGFLLILDAAQPTTTTTTTTTPAPTTTTTTTTGTGTTTTTTTPTTTTTTTTAPPMGKVTTTIIEESASTGSGSSFEVVQESNASNAEATKSSVFSKSITFGSIAPGERSKTLIAALGVPNVKGITNIKLGIIDIGNVEFTNNIFGVANDFQLTTNYVPETYFQGINTDGLSTNAYNISIPNRDSNNSNYVYLNVNLQRNSLLGPSVLRYKWWFDFAE